jgi:hypothetical protein
VKKVPASTVVATGEASESLIRFLGRAIGGEFLSPGRSPGIEVSVKPRPAQSPSQVPRILIVD